MYYLALCCIIKDEKIEYVREWLDFHSLIGVEKFFLYDNQSQVPLRQSLKSYVAQGKVTIFFENEGAELSTPG